MTSFSFFGKKKKKNNYVPYCEKKNYTTRNIRKQINKKITIGSRFKMKKKDL